jgi:hypothetical protein
MPDGANELSQFREGSIATTFRFSTSYRLKTTFIMWVQDGSPGKFEPWLKIIGRFLSWVTRRSLSIPEMDWKKISSFEQVVNL